MHRVWPGHGAAANFCGAPLNQNSMNPMLSLTDHLTCSLMSFHTPGTTGALHGVNTGPLSSGAFQVLRTMPHRSALTLSGPALIASGGDPFSLACHWETTLQPCSAGKPSPNIVLHWYQRSSPSSAAVASPVASPPLTSARSPQHRPFGWSPLADLEPGSKFALPDDVGFHRHCVGCKGHKGIEWCVFRLAARSAPDRRHSGTSPTGRSCPFRSHR